MKLQVKVEKHFTDFSLHTEFHIKDEPFGILGASGSGKSMTLRCIAGLLNPSKGRIILNGRVLFDSEKNINLPPRKRNIGYLFQNYALFPHLSVEANIAFGIKHLPKMEQKWRIEKQLETIQLTHLKKKYPYQLSGGQQQRVALARALVTNPEALLLDEPFSALDNHLRKQMEHELIEMLKTYDGVTLFVTHNLEEAYRVCNRIIIMDSGRVVANEERNIIFNKPPTRSAAKLTGCNNLSSIQRLTPSSVKAVDWGNTVLNFKEGEHLNGKSVYVGIRSHHIQFVTSERAKEKNVYPCKVVSFEEGPHVMTVFTKLNESSSSLLEVQLDKVEWKTICTNEDLFVYFPPNHLFLTEA